MKKALRTLGVTVVLLAVFFTGVYAKDNWKVFEGKAHITQTESNIDEILGILEDVDKGRKTAEEGKEELASKINRLEGTIELRDREILDLKGQLQDNESNKKYIEHLEKELDRANQDVKKLKEGSDKALEEARKFQGGE